MKQTWVKQKKIIGKNSKISWLDHLGPTFVEKKGENVATIFFSSRDKFNISKIGKFDYDFIKKKITKSPKLYLSVDKSKSHECLGVSYPFLTILRKRRFLFYVGWSKNKYHFKNDLCFLDIKKLIRKKVKIKNKYGSGSNCILKVGKYYFMWFTSFNKWPNKKSKFNPSYNIKFAKSKNLINWKVEKKVSIDFNSSKEFAISKPSVLRIKNKFHMWYCFRGKKYKIGYATSTDGISWKRKDETLRFKGNFENWDFEGLCYPSVICIKNKLYMVYSGKKYGKYGIGFFKLKNSLNDL